MCGIGGVLFHRDDDDGPRRGRPAPAFTRVLRDRLRHRGPDGAGVYVDDGVALVHTRLAIVDVEGGAQPISTPDGRNTLVVNGEIYDHARLRTRLESRGARFRTRSDAETLLWALVLDATLDVEGEYAFCLWDRERRVAMLGRDPLGVKPLVVARDRGATWFASEAQALLAVLPHLRVLDERALATAIVAPSLSGDDVPFRGIASLPPGRAMIVDAAGARSIDRLEIATRAPSSLGIADALAEAVGDRLGADDDVAVGAFLSGGVDSSAIVAAALRAKPRARVPFPCFSIRFDEARSTPGSIVVGDDAPFSETLAARWPIALHRVQASRAALVDDIEALVASQDRIVAWEQELTQRALARAASQHVKAVLVGDAADETHYGYAFALDADTCRSPVALLERFGLSRRLALLAPKLRALVDVDALDARFRESAASAGAPFAREGETGAASGVVRQNRNAMSALIRARWLPRLLHNGDLHTMAFGLEARVPFADRRVLSAADDVDVDDGFRAEDPVPEKARLREAVAPWLPSEIVARRKSALPRDEALGPLYRQMLVVMLESQERRERLAELLDLDAVAALGHEDDIGRSISFSVICFEGFLRHHSS